MSTYVSSVVNSAFNYDTLTGAYIADQYVTVSALASGDNSVLLSASIVGDILTVVLATCPDDVVLLVKSFTQPSAFTYATPAAWASGTTYSHGNLVTYNNVTYVSLVDSNTGNTPAALTADWMTGGTLMATVVINAASTAASGCTLFLKVGTN